MNKLSQRIFKNVSAFVLLIPLLSFSPNRESGLKTNFKLFIPNPASNTVTTGIFYLGTTVLTSSNGQYSLNLQTDYNLVLVKNSTGQALWASDTGGMYGIQNVQFQRNGNMVLYGGPGVWWDAKVLTSVTNNYWVLQDDGNLCRYTPGSNQVASTHTWGGQVSDHFGTIRY